MFPLAGFYTWATLALSLLKKWTPYEFYFIKLDENEGSPPNFAHVDMVLKMFRSSHRRCSVRKDVLRNFAKFTVKHLCQSLTHQIIFFTSLFIAAKKIYS